jgi:hypothetical protein
MDPDRSRTRISTRDKLPYRSDKNSDTRGLTIGSVPRRRWFNTMLRKDWKFVSTKIIQTADSPTSNTLLHTATYQRAARSCTPQWHSRHSQLDSSEILDPTT